MFLGHRAPSWKDFALVLYTHGQPGCPRPCAALSLCMAFLTWNVTRKSDVRCWAIMLKLDAFLVCLLQESSTSEWSSTGAMGCLCIFVGVSSHVAKPENSRWWRGACGTFCWQPRGIHWSEVSFQVWYLDHILKVTGSKHLPHSARFLLGQHDD